MVRPPDDEAFHSEPTATVIVTIMRAWEANLTINVNAARNTDVNFHELCGDETGQFRPEMRLVHGVGVDLRGDTTARTHIHTHISTQR